MSVALPRAEARAKTDAPRSAWLMPIGWAQAFMFALLFIAQLFWVALLTYGIWFAVT